MHARASGGGALPGEVDAAARAHGLAVPAGLVSHAGVGGLTLGSGMGWPTRKFGVSIDNLVSAEVVTAGGEVRRASAGAHRDLFRAIRGGGNSGVVITSFGFALREGGPVVGSGLSPGPGARARRRCGWPARSPPRCRRRSPPWPARLNAPLVLAAADDRVRLAGWRI